MAAMFPQGSMPPAYDNGMMKQENYHLMNQGYGGNTGHPMPYGNGHPTPPQPFGNFPPSLPQMAPAYQYIPPSPSLPLPDQYVQIEMRLCQALSHVMFGPPVTHIYNPLEYAIDPHKCYLNKYCQGKKDILFLGMNPGPYGMAQTGVSYFIYVACLITIKNSSHDSNELFNFSSLNVDKLECLVLYEEITVFLLQSRIIHSGCTLKYIFQMFVVLRFHLGK